MSIITSLLKKAAPERFALYQEHVRYEKAKQFHNLRVANGTSNGDLKQAAANLANTIRATRDAQVRQNLQNMHLGITSELTNRLDQARENQSLSIGTHLRLWRQAADSFRAGYNRFSLAAILKRDIGNEQAGWQLARGPNREALDTDSLSGDILPAPRMSREEALRTVEKHGITSSKDTNNRFDDRVGINHVKKDAPARANAAKAVFLEPLSREEGFKFTSKNSRVPGGIIEHTINHNAPAYGSVKLPPALGSGDVNAIGSSKASESEIIKFYREEAMGLLIRKEELENAQNPDPAAITKVEKRLADALGTLAGYKSTAPSLEQAKRLRAENENIRAAAAARFGGQATGQTAAVAKNPADVPLNSIEQATGYRTIENRLDSVATAHSSQASTGEPTQAPAPVEEPTYLDMSGAQAAVAAVATATVHPPASPAISRAGSDALPPISPNRAKAVLANPVVGANDAQLAAMGDFQAAWQVTSGAASADLTAAKNALKRVATEQFRELANEHPEQLGEWRKNIQERFYAFKIELSNAHRAGDDTGYLEALTQVHIAQAEFDEATRLLFSNKLEHAAQAKFIAIYERQAAKVTAATKQAPVVAEANRQLRETAMAHFARTHARMSADDAAALLFEAKAKITQLAITGATLLKERKELDAAGHTPYTPERTELRTRGGLYFAQAIWTEELIRFLENKNKI